MTTVYYLDNSTPGSNTSPYDTWAKAALLLSTLDAIDAAGDTIYVAAAHAETPAAGAVTYSLAGTAASPTTVMCATVATPVANSATGGKITANGTGSTLAINGLGVNIQGMVFECGSGATTTCSITQAGVSNSSHRYINCKFRLLSSGASSRVTP